MKSWKNKDYLKYLDWDSRDYPCMMYNGMFFIGHKNSSHSTMVQELLYNMDFIGDYYEMYSAKWNTEKGQEENPKTQGISYFRKDEDSEDYCFGSILGNEIFWYVEKKDKEFIQQIKTKVDKKFNNFIERNGKIIKI